MSPTAPSFTPKQGQYLAFIYAYTPVLGRPPAEADLQRHFGLSPPSVHQMVLILERTGLIRRRPGVPRSIEVLVALNYFLFCADPVAPIKGSARKAPREATSIRLALGCLSQCSLHGGIKRAEKSGAVPLGQRGWSAGDRSKFPEVPRYFTPGERIPYIRLRPLFASRGDDARPLLDTA